MVNQERLIDSFMQMLRIKSPSKNERQIADFITKELAKLGLEVINDNIGDKIGSDSGNIIAHFKGKKDQAPVFFAAHMDTVHVSGEVEPKINGKKIVNASKNCILGADDKAAIAAILESMRCIVENSLETCDLYLVFTVCEEIGLLGSKNMDLHLLKADIGFVFDSNGDIGTVITQAPYQDSMEVRFIGRPAHAGICPEKGINAIVAASKAISKIKSGRIDPETTCNIGLIKGGVAKNIVPDFTKIELEARSMKENKLKKVMESMTDRFLKASEESGTRLQTKIIREYDGYRLSRNDAPVQRALKALENIGIQARLEKTGGGSDTNIFNSKGKKAVNLSSGMENCHTHEEYIKIHELVKLARLVTELASNC